MKPSLLVRSLLLPAVCLSALAVHRPASSAPVPEAERGDQVVFLNFSYAASRTEPGPPARPVAEGASDQLFVELTSRDYGVSGAELVALEGDVRIGFELQGTATDGEDFKLVDENGDGLQGWLVLPAGKSRACITGWFHVDAEVDDWEDVSLTLQSVDVSDESGIDQRIDIGRNPTVRWVVREDTRPVIQFSHTTPGTFAQPSAKIVAAENADYWGLRLTDSHARTSNGTVAGNPITLDEPLELTFRVSGTAVRGMAPGVGVDYVLYGHLPPRAQIPVQFETRPETEAAPLRKAVAPVAPVAPVSSLAPVTGLESDHIAGGPSHVPLESGTSTVTVVMDAGAPGWAVWADFFSDEDDGFETVELQLIEARLATSGTPVTIGWNDRASWFKED